MTGPEVTVTGGPPPPDAGGEPAERRGGALAAVLLLAAAAGLAVAAQPPAPPPPPPVDARLQVVAERIATSQAGVVVVPVEIDNRGPGVDVVEVAVVAEPVRQDPASSGVQRVAAADQARVTAIVQPDCGVLAPGTGIVFAATVRVRLETAAGLRQDLVLDLDEDPAVAARLQSLCGGPTG